VLPESNVTGGTNPLRRRELFIETDIFNNKKY
jgi:hypothetical protein